MRTTSACSEPMMYSARRGELIMPTAATGIWVSRLTWAAMGGLVAGVDLDICRVIAAGGNICHVYSVFFEPGGYLYRLVDGDSAVEEFGGGEADEQGHVFGHDAAHGNGDAADHAGAVFEGAPVFVFALVGER